MRISDWSSDVCSSDLVIESIRQLFRHDCIGVSKPVENIIPRLDSLPHIATPLNRCRAVNVDRQRYRFTRRTYRSIFPDSPSKNRRALPFVDIRLSTLRIVAVYRCISEQHIRIWRSALDILDTHDIVWKPDDVHFLRITGNHAVTPKGQNEIFWIGRQGNVCYPGEFEKIGRAHV